MRIARIGGFQLRFPRALIDEIFIDLHVTDLLLNLRHQSRAMPGRLRPALGFSVAST